MKLSTVTRYAVRAVLELALNYGKKKLTLKDISKSQLISKKYLGRIMASLTSAGLVLSFRGKNGGFVLAREPSKIKLSEIIKVVEGSLAIVPCLDNPKFCKLFDICVSKDIWEKIRKAILDVLDSITLQDMVDMYKNKIKKTTIYYI